MRHWRFQPDAPPVLIARGAGYLIHGILYPSSYRGWQTGPDSGGVQILHTRQPSGEMRVLVASGTTSEPTRRVTVYHSRVVGIAADRARLFVLA